MIWKRNCLYELGTKYQWLRYKRQWRSKITPRSSSRVVRRRRRSKWCRWTRVLRDSSESTAIRIMKEQKERNSEIRFFFSPSPSPSLCLSFFPCITKRRHKIKCNLADENNPQLQDARRQRERKRSRQRGKQSKEKEKESKRLIDRGIDSPLTLNWKRLQTQPLETCHWWTCLRITVHCESSALLYQSHQTTREERRVKKNEKNTGSLTVLSNFHALDALCSSLCVECQWTRCSLCRVSRRTIHSVSALYTSPTRVSVTV